MVLDMVLNKVKLGSLITLSNEKNIQNLNLPFFGINIDKEFMPTVANTQGIDGSKYKVIRKNRFVFSGMQTGRDGCIRIGLYEDDNPVLLSPAYTTFEVTNPIVEPEYLFMIFKSKEMDRYGAFISDSSVRSNLDWDRFVDIEIDLPPIEIQRKYVAIYKGLKDNLKVYQSKLDDLKLVYEGYIEKLRKEMGTEEIGPYIQEVNVKNIGNIKNVLGVDSTSNFVNTKAKMNGIDLTKYSVVKEGQFAYNPSRINLGSIALRKGQECVISPMYEIFEIKDNTKLVSEYLFMWLTRKEFLRSTLFYAIGSVRDTFDFNLMKQVKIPIPSKEIQEDVVKIHNSYIKRKQILDKLKQTINGICPILIRGAIKEANDGVA